MRLAERHFQGPYQPVRKIGGGGIARACHFFHPRFIGRHVAHHASHRRNAERERAQRIDRAVFVLLHVFLIGERQPLHHHEQRIECADDAAGLGAHQFGRVRIALLRHHRGAGGELVGERNEPGERRAPQHDLFGKARQMNGANSGSRKRLQHEVAVGHRIERVRRRPREAELLRGHVAIERERCAGKRPRAERRFIEPRARIGKAAAVTRRHFHIGQQMVTERHRLRALQMRKSGHHCAGMRQRLFRKRALIDREHSIERVDRLPYPQLEIGRNLVVA